MNLTVASQAHAKTANWPMPGELDADRFEALISCVSSRLNEAPTHGVTATFDDLLLRVAHAFDLDMVSVLGETRGDLLCTHRVERVEQPHRVVGVGVRVGTKMPWFSGRLSTGHELVLRGIQDLPPEAECDLRNARTTQVTAMLGVPFDVGGAVRGALMCNRVGRPHPWDARTVSRMRTIAGMFANAVHRVSELLARREVLDVSPTQASHTVDALTARSPAFWRVMEHVDAVAATPAAVLIRGESGSGKEVIARAIHERSARAEGPLVKVNCAAVPRELFESEFFGHVKGAFTGAHRDRQGRFELASGGTLFLDEVGEIPLELQSKLLRVLQEGEIERVGDDRTRRVDVRIVAATNVDLEAEVAAGRFRRDLYYRLNVFPIAVPPLRERPEDIVPLAEQFLLDRQHQLRRRGLAFDDAQRRRMLAYHWPGNVRELMHVIERAVILSPSAPLRLDLALPEAQVAPRALASVRTDNEMRALERENLLAAVAQTGGRIAGKDGAAALLGVSPSTLRDRLRALDIEVPRSRA